MRRGGSQNGSGKGGGGAQAVQERGFAGGISEELGLAGTGTCSVRERGGSIKTYFFID